MHPLAAPAPRAAHATAAPPSNVMNWRNHIDHLVGAYKDRFGNGDPEGFRRLEVYKQLEPSWALNGEIGGFGAAQLT